MKQEFGIFRADGSLLYKQDWTEEEAAQAQERLGPQYEVRPGIVGMNELDEVVLEVDERDFIDDEDDTGVFYLLDGIDRR